MSQFLIASEDLTISKYEDESPHFNLIMGKYKFINIMEETSKFPEGKKSLTVHPYCWDISLFIFEVVFHWRLSWFETFVKFGLVKNVQFKIVVVFHGASNSKLAFNININIGGRLHWRSYLFETLLKVGLVK